MGHQHGFRQPERAGEDRPAQPAPGGGETHPPPVRPEPRSDPAYRAVRQRKPHRPADHGRRGDQARAGSPRGRRRRQDQRRPGRGDPRGAGRVPAGQSRHTHHPGGHPARAGERQSRGRHHQGRRDGIPGAHPERVPGRGRDRRHHRRTGQHRAHPAFRRRLRYEKSQGTQAFRADRRPGEHRDRHLQGSRDQYDPGGRGGQEPAGLGAGDRCGTYLRGEPGGRLRPVDLHPAVGGRGAQDGLVRRHTRHSGPVPVPAQFEQSDHRGFHPHFGGHHLFLPLRLRRLAQHHVPRRPGPGGRDAGGQLHRGPGRHRPAPKTRGRPARCGAGAPRRIRGRTGRRGRDADHGVRVRAHRLRGRDRRAVVPRPGAGRHLFAHRGHPGGRHPDPGDIVDPAP